MVQVEFPPHERPSALAAPGPGDGPGRVPAGRAAEGDGGASYSPLRTALILVPFTFGLTAGSAFAPSLMVLGRRLVLLGSS
jgi:hypothetical protein